jgi:uncharacterized membrane protein
MKYKVWLILSFVSVGILCQAGNLEAVKYHYQDLTLQGLTLNQATDDINAVNDAGWIVGTFYDAAYYRHLPFVWRPGLGRTTLPLQPGDVHGYANGINNAGRIVGERYISMSTDMPHYPCLWQDPSQLPLDCYVFDATKNSGAFGINDGGQIAGLLVFSPPGGPDHAARWELPQQSPVDLGTLGGTDSSGKSINNANQVVGTAKNNLGQNRACLWKPGEAPLDLAPFPDGGYFGSGVAVNNQGNAAGRADLTPGLGGGHAFFWDHTTGKITNMCPQDYESRSSGLSDFNQAVGYVMSMSHGTSVFYWTPQGGKKDLNQLVVNLPQGVTLQSAAAISRRGLITGFDSQGHPYLLTPIPTLSGEYLLLLLD